MPARPRKTADKKSVRQLTGWQARREDAAIIALFASPAVFIPGALDRYVFGKLLVGCAAAALAFSVPAAGALMRWARRALAGALATLLASAVLSAHPAVSILGRAPRYEGCFVLATYVLCGLAGARLFGPARSPSAVRVATSTMAWTSVAIATLSVLEAFGLRPLSSNLDRAGSLLGNASDQGAIGVLLAGVLIAQALHTRHWLMIFGAAAAVVTVVLSASRGAVLGLAVVLVVVVLLWRRGRRWVAGAAAGAVALAMAVPEARDRILGVSSLAGHTVSGRNLLWQETLTLLRGRPVLGIGPSQFRVAIVHEHDVAWQSQIGPADPPDSPHNWVLQALDAGGPLLLVLVAFGAVLVVRAVLRGERSAWSVGALAALGGYAIALLFHFTSPGTTPVAAALVGSVLSVPVSLTESHARAGRRAAMTACGFAAALAVVFAFASVAEVFLKQGTQSVASGDLSAADRDFRLARAFRVWDVDLPAMATHEFSVASVADSAALPYAREWLAHTGPVSDDEQVIVDHAQQLEVAQQFNAAIAVLNGALASDRDNPLLILRRGVLFGELHNYAHAESDFKRAAVISPTSPEPWQDLATLYRLEGRTSLAKAAAATADRLSRS